MSTNVFLVWAFEAADPRAVLARTPVDAVSTYASWCSIHQPSSSLLPLHIQEVGEDWLAKRPQLEQLVARAEEQGIPVPVVLVEGEHGWSALEVTEQPIDPISTTEPPVRSFAVKSDVEGSYGVEVMIFARVTVDALAMYLEYRTNFFGPVTHPYTIDEFSSSELTGAKEVLRELMEMGVTGIAGWSPTAGWSIYPPDHEMAGE